MTDIEEAERAIERHGAFERDGGAFAATTTPLDARVRLSDAGSAVRHEVVVRAPGIDAVVVGEAVAPVVQEGWFETFERRLEDVDNATRAEVEPPAVTRDGGDVVVEAGFETAVPPRGAEDAKAVVDYVEGTYVEGVIPGYDYREPVTDLVSRAEENAGTRGPPL